MVERGGAVDEANADPDVVPLMLLVVERPGHVASLTRSVHVVRMCSVCSALLSPGACTEIGPCTSAWTPVAAMRCVTHMAAMSLQWTCVTVAPVRTVRNDLVIGQTRGGP